MHLAGEGGMAQVWKARDRNGIGDDTYVAVKHMRGDLAGQGHYVAMFAEEARVGQTLRAPNLVEVRAYLVEGSDYYVIMEWVDGVDLGTWLRWHRQLGTRTDWVACVGLAIGTLRALAAAHERRIPGSGVLAPIVHRDVSPHNILLSYDGRVKVIDFGLALASDRTKETTDPGVVKGKMSYLAPEIANGSRPTPATDVFAAASVLWECLANERLFEASNDYEVFVKVRDCIVPSIRAVRPDLPMTLSSILHLALTENPAERPTATAFANSLAAVLSKHQKQIDARDILAESIARLRRDSQAEGIVSLPPDPPTPPGGLLFAPAKKLLDWGERLLGRKRSPTRTD